ncbi:MAG: leucine-rich repeat protein [Lachnospiraceae bacterium]|nr:leucine-rich repeat protein [Lachnospiraceae bacterium]
MKQHRFKNFVALFLVFVLVVGLLPIEDATVDAWAGSNTVTASNWAQLQSYLGRDNYVITLTDDIRAGLGDSGLVVTGSAITINLQSHSIDRGLDQSVSSATGAGFVLKVASGASVTITGATTRGYVTGGNNTGFGGGIVVEGGGKLTLGNVHIGGNKASTGKGVGVYLATGAALTLDGQVITGGTSIEGNYNDIFLNGGTLTLGKNFKSSSCVHVTCGVGDTIFSEKTTAEMAKAFHVYKADDSRVELSYDIYRNAYYLPNEVAQPTAKTNLTYNKADQTLINAGTASGGAIYYKKTDKNASKPEFINALGNVAEGWVSDASLVEGKDPGTYRVWYAVKGDDRYCTVDPAYVDVEIAKANMSITTSYNVSIVARKKAQYELTLDAPEDGFRYGFNSVSDTYFDRDRCKIDKNKLIFVARDWDINTSRKIVVGVEGNNFYNSASVEITVTADTKNDQSFHFSESSIEKTFGDDPFTNMIYGRPQGEVSYRSGNESVATVDAKGNVTIKGIGETTITVSAAGDNNFNQAEDSYTLKVTKGKPVITAPEGSTNLTFSPTATGSAIGYEQPLLEKAGIVSGGAIYYAVTDANATTAPTFDADNIDTNVWSSDIPKRSNAGTYKIFYAVKGDYGYIDRYDSSSNFVTVEIEKAKLNIGTGSHSKEVLIEEAKQGYTVDLHELGNDLTYGTPTVSGQVAGLISGASVSGHTLTFDTTSQVASSSAIIVIPVNVGNNYEKCEVNVTVTASVQSDQTITVGADEVNKVYGEASFKNEIRGAETTLTYEVTSGQNVVSVADDGTITIRGIGEARISVKAAGTAKYREATASFMVKVSKANSEVTKLPAAVEKLEAGSEAQKLIVEGEAKGGKLLYAVSLNKDEKPDANAYAEEIPEGTAAGIYYVYYMVKGNEYYEDYVPTDALTVEIKTPQVTPDPVDPSGSGSGSSTESGSGSGSSSTESGSVTEKTEEKKENDKENKNEDETPVVEPEVIKNEDGSTTTKTVEENEDGSTTTKEETQTSDGTTVTKEETVLADGSVIAKEEEVSTDGTVTTREETKNAKGEGTATVIKADADGNVLSETQETTRVNKKGSVTVETVTENADGSTVESTVKTTKSGNVTATIIEKDADGSVTTTNETVKNLSSGAVKTTTETVETDAEGNVVATVEKTVKVAKTDEAGNTKTTATVKSTDAAGNVTTTKETVVVDAKGKASVSSVTTSTDGTKEEKAFSVSSKGTVKMAALETNAKEVEIPKTIEVGGVERPVTSISKNAMKGNKNVTSVEIGENITSIGAGAFKNSKNLSTIELTDSITKISANAFKGIAKNATFKIKASSQEEFDRIVALLKDSGVSDTVTFEMA